jgi:hypothetical protein
LPGFQARVPVGDFVGDPQLVQVALQAPVVLDQVDERVGFVAEPAQVGGDGGVVQAGRDGQRTGAEGDVAAAGLHCGLAQGSQNPADGDAGAVGVAGVLEELDGIAPAPDPLEFRGRSARAFGGGHFSFLIFRVVPPVWRWLACGGFTDKVGRVLLVLLGGDPGGGVAPVGGEGLAAGAGAVAGVEGRQAGPGAVLDAGGDAGQGQAGPDGGGEDGLAGFGRGVVAGGVVQAGGRDAQVVRGQLPGAGPAWCLRIGVRVGVGRGVAVGQGGEFVGEQVLQVPQHLWGVAGGGELVGVGQCAE